MGRKDGLERRVLPYGWSLRICPGVSFGDQFTALCYSHTQLEGVCFCPEWSRLDSYEASCLGGTGASPGPALVPRPSKKPEAAMYVAPVDLIFSIQENDCKYILI